MITTQLADILRPTDFDMIVGQKHLFSEKGVVRRMIESGRITNMIFYGPPGTGKTTAASIIAKRSGMTFRKLNATQASSGDIKQILGESSSLFGTGGILLYIDEIQYFNRKQQQILLEHIEDGRVTLIASTTENPHFYVYNAIISRSSLFEFKPVTPEDCIPALRRALDYLNESTGKGKTVTDDILLYVARCCGGDVRRTLGLFENAYFASDEDIIRESVDSFKSGVGQYGDDDHYDLLSCLQKSIRGSDPDAAIFYLAKLLSAGELISACRRLQVIANEDIGLAYPNAAVITRACCESAIELGLPEAKIPLANAAVMLATSPKSNSAYNALHMAEEDIQKGLGTVVPEHLSAPLYKGYLYPHNYEDHYVKQQYLPCDLKDRKYYVPAKNKTEQAAAEYWAKIKK